MGTGTGRRLPLGDAPVTLKSLTRTFPGPTAAAVRTGFLNVEAVTEGVAVAADVGVAVAVAVAVAAAVGGVALPPSGMGGRQPPKLTLPSSFPPFSTMIDPNDTSPLNLPVEQICQVKTRKKKGPKLITAM